MVKPILNFHKLTNVEVFLNIIDKKSLARTLAKLFCRVIKLFNSISNNVDTDYIIISL